MDYTVNTTDGVVVSDSFFWKPINSSTPVGSKVLLINKKSGVATFGYLGRDTKFTHWAPLPRFKD